MSEPSEKILADLAAAFTAESVAFQRYTYFAQVAEIEGHVNVARILSELAASLACAAHGHLDFLREAADPVSGQPIGETALNLAAAVAGELREANEFYPRLADAAMDAGLADVASWMTTMSAL